jgi:hypothetical protein
MINYALGFASCTVLVWAISIIPGNKLSSCNTAVADCVQNLPPNHHCEVIAVPEPN